MPKRTRSVFWDDVERQLEDPEFRRHFVLEQNRIETVDRVMNLIMDALERSGTSRADVARRRRSARFGDQAAAQPGHDCPQPDPRDSRRRGRGARVPGEAGTDGPANPSQRDRPVGAKELGTNQCWRAHRTVKDRPSCLTLYARDRGLRERYSWPIARARW